MYHEPTDSNPLAGPKIGDDSRPSLTRFGTHRSGPASTAVLATSTHDRPVTVAVDLRSPGR